MNDEIRCLISHVLSMGGGLWDWLLHCVFVERREKIMQHDSMVNRLWKIAIAVLSVLAMLVAFAPMTGTAVAASSEVEALKNVKAIDVDGKPIANFDYRGNRDGRYFYSVKPQSDDIKLEGLPDGYSYKVDQYGTTCAGGCDYTNTSEIVVFDAKDSHVITYLIAGYDQPLTVLQPFAGGKRILDKPLDSYIPGQHFYTNPDGVGPDGKPLSYWVDDPSTVKLEGDLTGTGWRLKSADASADKRSVVWTYTRDDGRWHDASYTFKKRTDMKAPVFSVTGSNDVIIPLGTSYDDLDTLIKNGVTATDDVDGAVKVVREGYSYGDKIGEFEDTLYAADSQYNVATLKRRVLVVPVAPGDADLSAGSRSAGLAPADAVAAGGELTLQVGKQYAGQRVDAYLFSTRLSLGYGLKVAADGTVKVTVPADASAGAHRVAVKFWSDPSKVAWDEVKVAAALSFKDVDAKTPHADDIKWLASSGISTGWKEADGSATFRGMSSVKRQDMAAFLYRLAGSPSFDESKVKNPFKDVTSKTPHYKEIMWLYSTGISTGWRLSDGSYEFRGMNSVVRQDMAAFLHRLADYGKAKPKLGSGVAFKDVTSSTPHSSDIAWLAKTGVTTGWKESDGSTTFRGMSTVKRQDMAAFLHRMKLNVLK
ncbi:S-layer homology domain-containing protein [Bifidobacterium ramosum]|nr:S-layer homology domain-containing protein [Bifidobacterium ramosum]